MIPFSRKITRFLSGRTFKIQNMVATIVANGKAFELLVGKNNSNEHFFADFEIDLLPNGKRIKVTVHAKDDLVVEHIQLDLEQMYEPDTTVLTNSFQSNLSSLLYKDGENISKRTRLNDIQLGTKALHPKPSKTDLTSWSYTYLTLKDGSLRFWGSLKEWTGYTVFTHNRQQHRLVISKDCRGLALSHSYPALDIFVTNGTEATVFDRYFEQLGVHPRQSKALAGWSCGGTNTQHLLNHTYVTGTLKAAIAQKMPLDFIHIDAGWQKTVGDWSHNKEKFSKGLAPVATKIKEPGLKAGLTLAPFAVSAKSDMFLKNPEWLLRDAKGKPLKVAKNPSWGGDCYALNVLHTDVRDYLTGLFHTIVRKWGFDMIKLEGLYIAAAATPPDKTSGQIMFEVIQFVRNAVGLDTHLVVADVPISLAFGVVDACQIGPKIPFHWETPWMKRNQPSQDIYQIFDTWMARMPLGLRGFLADAQSVFVYDASLGFSRKQRRTLLLINALFGNTLTLADNIATLEPEQIADIRLAISLIETRVVNIETLLPRVYEIVFEQNGATHTCFCNLTGFELAIRGPQACSLAPFELNIRNNS